MPPPPNNRRVADPLAAAKTLAAGRGMDRPEGEPPLGEPGRGSAARGPPTGGAGRFWGGGGRRPGDRATRAPLRSRVPPAARGRRCAAEASSTYLKERGISAR